MDFKLQKIQTALFIEGFNIVGYDKYSFIGEVNNSIGDIFNAEPIVLPPLPLDAPLEIPRIILNSKEGIYTCNIALNRVDMFRNKPQERQERIENILDEQKKQTEKIYDFFKGKKVIINRVGFVVTFLNEIENKTGSEYLRKTFLVDNKLKNPRELQIIYNKQEQNNSIDFNQLFRIIGQSDNKVVLEIDINTTPELMAKSDFNKNNLSSILDYSIQKIIDIEKNFPNI